MHTVCTSLAQISLLDVPEVRESIVVGDMFPHAPQHSSADDEIFSIGNHFESWFGIMVQAPIPQSILSVHLLAEPLPASEIIRTVGDVIAETTFAHLFSVWKTYKDGTKERALSRYGDANLFFIRDTEGVLRIANLHEYGRQWAVLVCDLDIVSRWPLDTKVFARTHGD